jgi:hypothetical protein
MKKSPLLVSVQLLFTLSLGQLLYLDQFLLTIFQFFGTFFEFQFEVIPIVLLQLTDCPHLNNLQPANHRTVLLETIPQLCTEFVEFLIAPRFDIFVYLLNLFPVLTNSFFYVY